MLCRPGALLLELEICCGNLLRGVLPVGKAGGYLLAGG